MHKPLQPNVSFTTPIVTPPLKTPRTIELENQEEVGNNFIQLTPKAQHKVEAINNDQRNLLSELNKMKMNLI